MSFVMSLFKKIAESWFGGSDYYRIIYTIYVLGSTWMLRRKYLERNIYFFVFFRCVQFAALVVVVVCIFSFTYDAYAMRKDIERLAYNLGSTFFFVMSVFRFAVSALKKDELEEMLDTINNNLYVEAVGKSHRDLRVLKRGEMHLRRLAKGFYCLMVAGVSTRVLCHAASEKSLPIPFPYIQEIQSPGYEILFGFEALGFAYFVGLVITQEMVTFGILIRVLKHFDILCRNISEVGDIGEIEMDKTDGFPATMRGRYEPKWQQKLVFVCLKRNIIHHQEIVKVMRRASKLLQASFFIQIFGGGMLLVDLFFHVTLQNGNILMLLCQFIYSGSALLDISITCYYGSEIEKKCDKAARTLYSINWLEMDLKNRKTLKFFQQALWKYPVIKAGYVFSINLAMYLKFLNSIYSYLAFMQNTVRRSG